MNTQWSAFMQSRPASVVQPTGEVCILNDLSHFSLLRVSGEDAEGFLQGQMTNDMREVTAGHSNLCGWCTVKGRMLANYRALRQGDDFLLQTPAGNMAVSLKRLQMFVMRSKVTITDASDELVRFGFTGNCAEALLQPHFADLPGEANSVVEQNNLILIRLSGELPRFEIIGPVDESISLWEALESETTTGDSHYWALQNIRAGIPTIFPETAEAFVPQMTNMQLVDGVSFTKGCYTGQEVVARMHYLGKLKRRMYLAHVSGDIDPKPGDALYAADSHSGQGAGKVVDAQAADGGFDLLVVIEVANAENEKITLGETGPALEIRNLPYEFTSESE
ncbi:MAG: folate-binding protein YgfZ [gamma proteobacterium endosymbiont of Lamellibrachia anaximandri]|nr:folate-binding protein YgfZ [gamma proteobacterium endosymbiont of Lamellibrachia anaximandri]MBL3532812.1 folate-binding protein YgfZ [gamma proteobacterium endosymbiont of Lamellibrachia anaximandri]